MPSLLEDSVFAPVMSSIESIFESKFSFVRLSVNMYSVDGMYSLEAL